jgi:hypothetical protein
MPCCVLGSSGQPIADAAELLMDALEVVGVRGCTRVYEDVRPLEHTTRVGGHFTTQSVSIVARCVEGAAQHFLNNGDYNNRCSRLW